ncbi:MAG: hypothetical protein ACRDCF_02180 [Mycoplasmoidaceae bacterium]
MNKKIKLGLLGTLITASALTITLPIMSCSGSSSEGDVVVDEDYSINNDLVDKEIPPFTEFDVNVIEPVVGVLYETLANTNAMLTVDLAFKTRPEQEKVRDYFVKDKELSKGDDIFEFIVNQLKFENAYDMPFAGKEVIEKLVIIEGLNLPNKGETIKGPAFQIVYKTPYLKSDTQILDIGLLGTEAK